MLPVECNITQITFSHMFSIVHSSTPEYLKNNIFTVEPALHTRASNLACFIRIPNIRGCGFKSFFLTGSIFKKMIRGTLWKKLRCANISEY